MNTYLQFAEIFGNKHTTASFLVERNQELRKQIITYKHIDKLDFDGAPAVFFIDSFNITREPRKVLEKLFSDLVDHPNCLLVIVMEDPQSLYEECRWLNWPDNVWIGMNAKNVNNNFSLEFILECPTKVKFVLFADDIVDFSENCYNLWDINFVIWKGDINKSFTPNGDNSISFLLDMCIRSGMTYLLSSRANWVVDNTRFITSEARILSLEGNNGSN